MALALALFIVTYVLLLGFPNKRAYIALASAAVFIVLGVISLDKAFLAIDFNVLLMIMGTMGTVLLFVESKMPALMADIIINKTSNVKWMIVCMCIFTGVVSAFIDNVATILMIAPVAILLAKKVKISPVPMLISMSIFSNLEGASTLVGDTVSILLAGTLKLDFLDFFVYNGKTGLFFIVQIGLLMSSLLLTYIFRNEKAKTLSYDKTKVTNYVPTILLIGTVLMLIFASFFPDKPSLSNGVICMSFFIIGLLCEIFNHGIKGSLKYLKEIDYKTILLLGSLFIVIGAIQEAGVIDAISTLLMKISGDNIFILYTLLVFVSVLASAFIDNIPYVATMLPVVTGIGLNLGIDATPLFFGLIVGATLGGNLTPIGATTNITTLGILNKEGYMVNNKEFIKISIPITIIAVLTGYILVWLIYGV